jgi:hypothetical protein
MSDIHADQFRDLAASPITGRHFTGRPGWGASRGSDGAAGLGRADVPAGILTRPRAALARLNGIPRGADSIDENIRAHYETVRRLVSI